MSIINSFQTVSNGLFSSNNVSKTIASFESLNDFGVFVEWATQFGKFNTDLIVIDLEDSDANRDFVVFVLEMIHLSFEIKFDFVFLLVNLWSNLLVDQVLDNVSFNNIWVE